LPYSAEDERVADAVVLGGGPAGCAAAISLRNRGRSVILVDRVRNTSALGETLPPEATPALQQLGVWERFLASGHEPAIGNESAWGSATIQRANFIYSPYGRGWHLDRTAFDDMLMQTATSAGVIVQSGRVRDAHFGERWHLVVEPTEGPPHHVTSAWLVDATGRTSAFAASLGVARKQLGKLTASALLFRRAPDSAADTDRMTLVETAPFGWWYTAPLPASRRMVMCFTRPEDAARTVQQFMYLLAQTLHSRARVTNYVAAQPAPRLSVANSSLLVRMSGPGWIAAGDAAAAHDPVSSFGLASSLTSGMRAAAAIDAVIAGHAHAPAEYELAMRNEFDRYARTLIHVYGLERRWPESAFWRHYHLAKVSSG
jgi:flavin-dependent dehydrogenase